MRSLTFFIAAIAILSSVLLLSFGLSPSFAQSTPQPANPQSTVLYAENFEEGFPENIYTHWTWNVTKEGDNTIYCNEPESEWTNFTFGFENWDNYAVSLQAKYEPQEFGASVEVYMRIDTGFTGYRATLWDRRAGIAYYSPYRDLKEMLIRSTKGEWHTIEVRVFGDTLQFYLDDRFLFETHDDARLQGMAGFGASPRTRACVDNIVVRALDENGNFVEATTGVVSELSKYESDCIFCFVNGSIPGMPLWNPETGGWQPQADDAREQLVIDETFHIGPYDEVRWENVIVWVRPHQRRDIEVYGTLIIKNSLILWDQTQHQQTRLRIKRGGALSIENSYVFSSNAFWVNWEYEDGSTIHFDHYIGQPWGTIYGSVQYEAINYSTAYITLLNWVHDTSINITDAHSAWLELYIPTGEHTITIPQRKAWTDWTLSDLWPRTTIHVTHSLIYETDIGISADTHITVKDSPGGFSLGWVITNYARNYVECTLRDLGDPEQDEGVFYEYQVFDLPCINSSLTVDHSKLQRAWPVALGYVHLKIEHSNLVDPRVTGPARMEIYDSTIEHVAAYQGGVAYVEDSLLRYDIEVKDPHSIIYGYKVFERDRHRTFAIIEVDGGRYVELQSVKQLYTVRSANLRACASTTCNVVATAVEGEALRIIGEEHGQDVAGNDLWYKVYDWGDIMYIHSALVTSTSPTATPTPQ